MYISIIVRLEYTNRYVCIIQYCINIDIPSTCRECIVYINREMEIQLS